MKLERLASFLMEAFLAAITLCFLLFHPAFQDRARAQNQKVGYSGRMPTNASADELQSEFQLGGPKQREDLLMRLGVSTSIAHTASTATVESTIRVEVLGKHMSILFLPCAGPGIPTAHLFLLRAATSGWHNTDNVPLDCWFQNATYQILRISGRPQQAVLAHHVNNGHGSGFVQDDMLLYELRNGRLVNVLRTAEYKREQIAGTERTVEEQSGLLTFPDGSIEETRSTTFIEGDNESQRHLVRIERRRWKWNKSSSSFTPGKFIPITD